MRWLTRPFLYLLYLMPLLASAGTVPMASAVNGGLIIHPLPAGLAIDTPLYAQGQRLWVGHLPDRTGPQLVVGIPLDAKDSLTISRQPDGREVMTELALTFKAYPEQRLRLREQKYVTPDPDQLARFRREAAEQQAAYRVHTLTASDQWPTFRWPLQGRISSPFGLRRFFNDEPRAPHVGIDIARPTGTPVVAPADGVVALTGDYFFNGRTVIIDHGRGLFSMLCHFSEVMVAAGDRVQAGDVVGRVGATGRATGPHLHWTVSLNDARIDPALLVPPLQP